MPCIYNGLCYVCVPKLMNKNTTNCVNIVYYIYTYMRQTTQLHGNWVKDGNFYTNRKYNFILVLASRKYKTENKPDKYILIKHQDNKPEYLSGLFPTQTQGIYKIDYKGKRYTFQYLDTTNIIIKLIK